MIDRTKERIKQTGEVFTPIPLVDEILDKLPPELFIDPTKTFLDPACGDGNFLVQVIKRKIKNGSTKTQAMSTTYGVDLMPDNINHCKIRLLKIVGEEHINIIDHNIVCHNTLTFNFDDWEPYTDTPLIINESSIEDQFSDQNELVKFLLYS